MTTVSVIELKTRAMGRVNIQTPERARGGKKMSMIKCKICDEWIGENDNNHKCDPAWEVCSPDLGDDWMDVYALDAEFAAEKWAERFDSDTDYALLGGDEEIIIVRKKGETKETSFRVSGEAVPKYTATEITEE